MQEPYTLSGQKDISAEPLADIRHVSVNKDLSREERIAEFVRQIKDPYCFKCGKFTVRPASPRAALHWKNVCRASYGKFF